jgi:hypothetical protein
MLEIDNFDIKCYYTAVSAKYRKKKRFTAKGRPLRGQSERKSRISRRKGKKGEEEPPGVEGWQVSKRKGRKIAKQSRRESSLLSSLSSLPSTTFSTLRLKFLSNSLDNPPDRVFNQYWRASEEGGGRL